MKRKAGERVEIIFLVTYNGIVVSASLAEMAFQKMSDIKMSAILGYPVCNFSVTPYGGFLFFFGIKNCCCEFCVHDTYLYFLCLWF